MKLNKLSIVLAALLAAVMIAPMPAMAQTVHQRLQNQKARIRQGIHSGELTRGEAKSAIHSTKRIARRAAIDRAKHGGHLTPTEKNHLQSRLNKNSRKIYRLKHNGAVRP